MRSAALFNATPNMPLICSSPSGICARRSIFPIITMKSGMDPDTLTVCRGNRSQLQRACSPSLMYMMRSLLIAHMRSFRNPA